MIQCIDFLKGFGLFQEFIGDDSSGIPAFKKYNLLYGWNYSGKTTLSRVFQAIEKQTLPKDCTGASFRMTLDDETKLNSSDLSSPLTIRVFNRDYVNSNFRQEHTAPAIFILGEEKAALRTRLIKLQNRKSRVIKAGEDFEKKRSVVVEGIDKLGTDRARDISHLLGDRNFRRPTLEQLIEKVRQDPDSHLLDDETVKARLATLRSGYDLSVLSEVPSLIPDFQAIAQEVNRLLSQTASNLAIDTLKNNVDLESWVRQGLKLHQDAAICEFCRSPLSDERLAMLKGHFSEAYENLMRGLESKIKDISSFGLQFDVPDSARFMPDIRRSVTETKRKLDTWRDWAIQTRDQLIEALEKKRKAIERQTKWENDLSRASDGGKILQAINDAIILHNRMLSDLEQTKADAKSTLEKHYSAQYYLDNDIQQKETQISFLENRGERAEKATDRIARQIRAIEKKSSQSAIGADKLNVLLKHLLAGSNIEVISVGESEFRFLRGGEPATNLSDGEKTAVTLAYFLTSLEADGTSPEDVIVFVDDPVSSLDSNHIYAAYALIVERLKNCHQIFVSTHNSEFFSLLKSQWLKTEGGNRKETSAYWIYRDIQSDGVFQARVENLPRLLRKYKSEYEFVFSKLFELAWNEAPSEHEAYTAPNLLRKFLEAYLGFRKPDVRAWHKKLNLLFDSPEKCKEVQKFADDASHLQNLDRSLNHPTFVASSQRCIRDVFEALREKDEEHYLSLERVVTGIAS